MDEMQVTREMVQAGALALSEYDHAFETLEECAIRIFLTCFERAADWQRQTVLTIVESVNEHQYAKAKCTTHGAQVIVEIFLARRFNALTMCSIL